MSRERVSLGLPGPRTLGAGFPSFIVTPGRTLFRVVREGQGPWWFGSDLGGRFDLVAPLGTCYLSSDDLGALLEVLGPDLLPGGCAPAALLDGRHLRQVCVPRPLRLADTLAERASAWVTAEIATVVPYRLPQAWAAFFHEHGFGGVRYSPRHSASTRRYAVALFGRAGERRSWKRSRAIPIDDACRERLAARCGIRLFDTPAVAELQLAPE